MLPSDAPAGPPRLRATRAFRSEAIEETKVGEILQAGRWTGSSLNSQPWTFVVITDQGLKQSLSQCGKFASHLSTAPLVVALVAAAGRGEFDIGRAAENMMIAADAVGIGSCPATLHHHDQARSLLNIPLDHSCRHAVAFGYPDAGVESTVRKQLTSITGRGRRPLAELVRWNTFDQEAHP